MKIQKYQPGDCDDLYRLYREQAVDLPFHHNARRDQFRTDLFTTRFIRNPADHHPKAKTALVVKKGRRLCGFVSGGLVVQGDEVVESRTGHIQAVIAEPDAAGALKDMLAQTVAHLRRFRPKKIVAQDACLSPTFFNDSAGNLPSQWSWIGQCLLDVGFEVDSRSLRLVNRLDEIRNEVSPPDKLKLAHIHHEMHAFDERYDFGCLLLKPPYDFGDGVAWSGNFYSGAFVKGTAYRSLYMNYFTILDQAYRGVGLGRLVLRHCLFIAQQKGATFASLLTDFDNLIAQNLYQSEGFELVDAMHSFVLKRK